MNYFLSANSFRLSIIWITLNMLKSLFKMEYYSKNLGRIISPLAVWEAFRIVYLWYFEQLYYKYKH